MDINMFPDFGRNFEDDLIERYVENSTMMQCETVFGPVYEKPRIVLPKSTEGILIGGHVVVMIFSGCGNIAALIIVGKSKAPKISTKYFLMMLAFSDLLMTIIAPPTEIVKMMGDFGEWTFGALMCKLVPFFQILSAIMSALCLMAIAAERNLLIVRAMSSSTSIINRLWEKWVVPIIASLIFLVPIACALPQIWQYQQVTFQAIVDKPPLPPSSSFSSTMEPEVISSTAAPATTPDPSCDIRYYCIRNDVDKHNIIYWSVTGATYFFLLLWFLISYISIYKFVNKHGRVRKQLEEDHYSTTTSTTAATSTSTNSTNHNNPSTLHKRNKLVSGERHKKTLKLILGLILLHVCCRAPNWIYLVIINVKTIKISKISLTLLETFHFLSTINCALDPFLYVIWNHSLRASKDEGGDSKSASSLFCRKTGNSLHAIVCCRCCCKRKRGSMDGHIPTDPVVIPTSSVWLWKTPTVYHISNGSDNGGGSCDINKKTDTATNVPVFHFDKSTL